MTIGVKSASVDASLSSVQLFRKDRKHLSNSQNEL